MTGKNDTGPMGFSEIFDELIRLYDAKEFAGVIALADQALKQKAFRVDPETAHLLYTRKAESQLELGKHRHALDNARKAVSMCPTCPYSNSILLATLENYALRYRDEAVLREAIALARRILRRGADSILADPCMKKKKTVANAYIADAWFLLGHLYMAQGDKRKAIEALNNFVTVSRNGRYTDYTVDEARETLKNLTSRKSA